MRNQLTQYGLYGDPTETANTYNIAFECLKAKRTGLWFETFLKYTNQKTVTANKVQNLLHRLQESSIINFPLSILDVGCGEGELAFKVLKAWDHNITSLSYYGIDSEPRFIDLIKNSLIKLEVNYKLIVGNCFNEDINLLPKADIVLASNVAYYAPSVEAFVSSLLAKKKNDGILISIHESSFSTPNILRERYKAKVDTKTAYKISTHLREIGVNFSELQIASKIDIPLEPYNTLSEILQNSPDCKIKPSNSTPLLKEIKMLLEFIVQLPLEQLKHEGVLEKYLTEVAMFREREKISIPITSIVHLVIPDTMSNQIDSVLNQQTSQGSSLDI